MTHKTEGLLPLPVGRVAMEAELDRVERVAAGIAAPAARRLFAIERRRLIIAIDQAKP